VEDVRPYHPRKAIAEEECTRDPIFLFQLKRTELAQIAFHTEYYVEDERFGDTSGAFLTEEQKEKYDDIKERLEDLDEESKEYEDASEEFENLETMTDEELVDYGLAVSYWDTQPEVFLSREEGERYAESRPYRYGEKWKNWKIYCMCAEGELAAKLVDGVAKGTNYLGNTPQES
jgi:hypothetical protein